MTDRGSGLAPPSADENRRILLLQGPVGPFFVHLHEALEARGADVCRVIFNAGDKLFAPNHSCERFSGSRDEWAAWLKAKIDDWSPDAIILFGCKRPAHLIAADLADATDTPLYSLEEGYVRSGFVTCERGGNNDRSPLMGRLPMADEAIVGRKPAKVGPAFKVMSWWGFSYYTVRQFFSKRTDRQLYHRLLLNPLGDGLFWLGNVWRLFFRKFRERQRIESLCRNFAGDFLLVPLQMPSDSQMGKAANGWSIDRLIEAVVTSFAAIRPTSRLMFKLHPLDGEAPSRERLIRQTAQRLGVSEEVNILHSGSIAELSTHSDGMIVINSTCGFTAIHHGTPLLVLGHALFRNPALATCGDDQEAIDAFMQSRFSADEALRTRYLSFVTCNALLPGDFYVTAGMEQAAINIADRVLGDLSASRDR